MRLRSARPIAYKTPMESQKYRGRFAPSPTGPLHFGSLVAALGSWLDARSSGGEWFLRIEDIDRPREEKGAVASILSVLEACGLEWDGSVEFQSRRTALYEAAMDRLKQSGQAFPCACTRREIADSSLRPGVEPVYPGTCRHGLPKGRDARAWRVRVDDAILAFEDLVQGPQRQNLATEVGDFVVLRADGFHAYQLAVVVDDAEQGVTHVVRGADLLDSTARQVFLQRQLSVHSPSYAHLPVATNAAGEKLSKQTLATAISESGTVGALFLALQFLGQQPPAELEGAPPRELLDWSMTNWSLAHVPRVRSRPAPV
jgi:glutamyl-Q tRNA(Asp) synthetase